MRQNCVYILSLCCGFSVQCWDLTDDGNMTHTFKVGTYLNQPNVKHKVNYSAWSPDSKRLVAVGTFKTVSEFTLFLFHVLTSL